MDGYGVVGDAEGGLDWHLRCRWSYRLLDHDRSQPEPEVSRWHWDASLVNEEYIPLPQIPSRIVGSVDLPRCLSIRSRIDDRTASQRQAARFGVTWFIERRCCRIETIPTPGWTSEKLFECGKA